MNKLETQERLPALVEGAGYGEDGHFYLKAVIKDGDREIPSLIRQTNAQEVFNGYKDKYPDLDDHKIGTKAKNKIKSRGANTLESKVVNLVRSNIKEGLTDTTDFETELKNLKMNILVSDASIVGSIPSGKGGENFALDGSPQGLDANTVNIVSADHVFVGMALSKEAENTLPYEDAPIGSSVRRAVISVDFTPADNAYGNEAKIEIKEKLNSNMVNASQISDGSFEGFNHFLKDGLSVADPDVAVRKNIRDSKMDFKFTAKDGQIYSHEINFNVNDVKDFSDTSYKTGDYLDFHEFKDEYTDLTVSDILNMKDKTSSNPNANPKDIVKMDTIRIMALMAYQPERFNEFASKVNAGDKTAYEGITKIDYAKDNISEDEKFVKDLSQMLSDELTRKDVLVTTSQERELYLEDSARNEILQNVSDSYYRHINSEASPHDADTDTKANMAWDVFKGESRRVDIQAYIMQSNITALDVDMSDDPDDMNPYPIMTSEQVVPAGKFVTNPMMEKKAGTHKYVKDITTLAKSNVYSNIPMPNGYLEAVQSKTSIQRREEKDFSPLESFELSHKKEVLDGVTAEIRSGKSSIDKNVWKGVVEKNEKLGLLVLNDPHEEKSIKLSARNPETQLKTLAFRLGNPTKFREFANKEEPQYFRDGTVNADHNRINETYDRFLKVYTTLKDQLPPPPDKKTAGDYLKINHAFQTMLKGGELNHAQQKLCDMMLTNKMVEVTFGDKIERHNFWELAGKSNDTNSPLPQAARDPIEPEPYKALTNDTDKNVNKIASINEVNKFALSDMDNAVKNAVEEVRKQEPLSPMEMALKHSEVASKAMEERNQPQSILLGR